jgi:hypothetical protein
MFYVLPISLLSTEDFFETVQQRKELQYDLLKQNL